MIYVLRIVTFAILYPIVAGDHELNKIDYALYQKALCKSKLL